jgi:hypothetical protein
MLLVRSLVGICVVVALSSSPGRLFTAEQPVTRTFKAKGVKIHYLIQGKGTAVVLIHGLNSSADLNWRVPGIMAELVKDEPVCCPCVASVNH